MIGPPAFYKRDRTREGAAVTRDQFGAQLFNMFHCCAVFRLYFPSRGREKGGDPFWKPQYEGASRNLQQVRGNPMRAVIIATALAGLMGVSPTLADGQTNAVFGISIRGLNAGTLTIKGSEQSGAYQTTGELRSGGLVGLVARLRYTAKAQGAVRGARFSPSRYDETADTGKRTSRTTMTYSRGVPKVVAGSTGTLKPASQKGTVDPLTAIYAAFRNVEADQVCKLNVQMFDGKRRSQVRLSSPRPEGDQILCNGEYRRLDGFSAEDMAEKTRFPFNLYYTQTPRGDYRVERVVTQTLYGNAVMTRR